MVDRDEVMKAWRAKHAAESQARYELTTAKRKAREEIVKPIARWVLMEAVRESIDIHHDQWTLEVRDRFEKVIREAAYGFVRNDLAGDQPKGSTVTPIRRG